MQLNNVSAPVRSFDPAPAASTRAPEKSSFFDKCAQAIRKTVGEDNIASFKHACLPIKESAKEVFLTAMKIMPLVAALGIIGCILAAPVCPATLVGIPVFLTAAIIASRYVDKHEAKENEVSLTPAKQSPAGKIEQGYQDKYDHRLGKLNEDKQKAEIELPESVRKEHANLKEQIPKLTEHLAEAKKSKDALVNTSNEKAKCKENERKIEYYTNMKDSKMQFWVGKKEAKQKKLEDQLGEEFTKKTKEILNSNKNDQEKNSAIDDLRKERDLKKEEIKSGKYFENQIEALKKENEPFEKQVEKLEKLSLACKNMEIQIKNQQRELDELEKNPSLKKLNTIELKMQALEGSTEGQINKINVKIKELEASLSTDQSKAKSLEINQLQQDKCKLIISDINHRLKIEAFNQRRPNASADKTAEYTEHKKEIEKELKLVLADRADILQDQLDNKKTEHSGKE